jgi:hypothetical protein
MFIIVGTPLGERSHSAQEMKSSAGSRKSMLYDLLLTLDEAVVFKARYSKVKP